MLKFFAGVLVGAALVAAYIFRHELMDRALALKAKWKAKKEDNVKEAEIV